MEISLTDALPIPFALDQASSDQTYDFRGMAPRRTTGFASDQMRASTIHLTSEKIPVWPWPA
jgi:hypothetical protein